jgi:Integrase core domain
MSRVTEAGMDEGAQEDIQRAQQRAVGERETRWSARRKEGVVMRLLRGESLDLLAHSPAYHYEPETNGCAEKLIQTLREQVLWIERFASFGELRAAVRRFAVTYNHEWLLERHGYRTPIEARAHLAATAQAVVA